MTIYQPTIALGKFINGNTTYQDTYLDDNNNIAMIFDQTSIAQTVQNAISLFLAEYQFDITIGIDWQSILGEQLNRVFLNNLIQKQILALNYVKNIASINYLIDNQNRITGITVTYFNSDNVQGTVNANF